MKYKINRIIQNTHQYIVLSFSKHSRILSYIIFIIMLIFFIELFLRLSGKYKTWMEKNGRGYISIYKNLDSWFYLRPKNSTINYKQKEFKYTIKTNSLGLRDIEHPLIKSQNEYRIIALGDSFTEGHGVKFEHSWPKVLENLLQNKISNKKIKIINAGVAGSDSIFCYKLLKAKLLKYKPDLVILTTNTNDLYNISIKGGTERFKKNGKTVYPSPKLAKYEWIFSLSHLFRVIILKILKYNWYLIPKKEFNIRIKNARITLVKIIYKFNEICLKNNTNFLLIILPSINNKNELLNMNLLNDYEKFNFNKKNINYINLYQIFKKSNVNGNCSDFFWKLDRHLNIKGYYLVAKSINDYLSNKDFLKNQYN